MLMKKRITLCLLLLTFLPQWSSANATLHEAKILPATAIKGSARSDALTSDAKRLSVWDTPEILKLNKFAPLVLTGNPEQVVGIHVDGVLELKVVAQPPSNPAYISSEPHAVTQFSLAARYGTLGFLAHNFLSGGLFFDLQMGDTISVVYGNGDIKYFMVLEIKRYRALDPTSTTSSFIEIGDGNPTLRVNQLFDRIYAQPGNLVLQTCFLAFGDRLGGRYFVIAGPVQADETP
jgi:hypothetical protein